MALTCLLTIHGIGFQQFPHDDVPGYADGLHQKLLSLLPAGMLGDDPQRTATGQAGPVYVSDHAPGQNAFNREDGVSRLGTLRADGTVDVTGQELAPAGSTAAHVALVYSNIEDTAPLPGSMADVIVRGLFGVTRYATVHGLGSMLFHDVAAALHHGPPAAAAGGGELRVRDDAKGGHHPVIRMMQAATPGPATPGGGVFDVLRTVEDDVAAYVCRNDLRQRVRDFVGDALARLALRPDIDRIIVNAHSQGTVIAFDVLAQMSPATAGKVRWLITAGSPLRKYVQTLDWGSDAAHVTDIPQWLNAWDADDPVADPLAPDHNWKRGQALTATTPTGLFRRIDWTKGTDTPATVVDCEVHNVRWVSGTGLRAHDYWGDLQEFVTPLAAVMEDVATGAEGLTARDFCSKFANH